MGRYRKKPVEIEAVQLAEGNEDRVLEFLNEHGVSFLVTGELSLEIETLEGWMRASPGDWLIRGVEGEFYPCKPSVFEATYEEAA